MFRIGLYLTRYPRSTPCTKYVGVIGCQVTGMLLEVQCERASRFPGGLEGAVDKKILVLLLRGLSTLMLGRLVVYNIRGVDVVEKY